jgi:hypothetical protein
MHQTPETILIENKALRLEFSAETGALIGCLIPGTGWAILDRPHLGLSFKLFVPAGRRRNNPVDGETQVLSGLQLTDDGQGVRFFWDGVDSLHAECLPIRVEVRVRLEEHRAVWTMHLSNRSEYVIEAACLPYFGDLRPPAGCKRLVMETNGYNGPNSHEIWPHMPGNRGYFGVDHPYASPGVNRCQMPMSPFVLVRDDQEGLFISMAEAEYEYVAGHTELIPGHDRSIDSRRPPDDRVSQHEVSTRFGLIHFPYVQPGEERRLTPVAVQPYRGDWHAGLDVYRNSSTKPVSARAPSWISEPHSWLQIHINSPEGEARVPYRELPALAGELARNGIKGMQITGWTMGGQDQDNPSHDTDPLLGTREELLDAIAAIKNLNVKVILFTKYTWADQAREDYEDKYRELAVTDPWGDPAVFPGYMYQTPMQLFDISTKRLIPMCFLSEKYLEICEEEFQKVLNLGADGMLFDECVHHGPAILCFHPDHGHRPGALCFANDNHLIERFHRLSDPENPDFAFTGEALYDWEFGAYHLSYFRSEDTNHLPWQRYLRPDAAIMTAVTGFDDREMIAQCLLYRYIISYEPFNFKGRPGDYPLTLEYGKRMDALRSKLRRWFWDGEFRDTVGAKVSRADGGLHHPYAVFAPRDGGPPGIAIANYNETESVTLYLRLDGGDPAEYRWQLIDSQAWRSATDGIEIPPRGAAVVVPSIGCSA